MITKFRSGASLLAVTQLIPKETRRAALDGLARHPKGYRVFQALARAYGVTAIRVAGEYGLIEGAIEDGSILQAYARTKRWASAANRFFCDLFARGGGTYIDIGANIGLTTIPVAQNPRVACKAFEPEPRNFHYLAGNVARNCAADNVELFNLALFDRRAVLDFDLSPYNLGDHRIRLGALSDPHDERGREVIKVAAERLDDVLDADALAGPVAVKIDTQGAEARILAGGRRVLARAQALVFEYAPRQIVEMGGEPEALARFAAQHYATGAVVPGDSDAALDWQPIDTVAARLCALAAGARPDDYYEVYARK
ncbi:MAG TPA: FkbM family methyltransferase [Alphaproteobacteria bacterium]|nr:FkbM family methyltransferase [Alphaproteobacteria bacterium]